jgi:hypothetical protein
LASCRTLSLRRLSQTGAGDSTCPLISDTALESRCSCAARAPVSRFSSLCGRLWVRPFRTSLSTTCAR